MRYFLILALLTPLAQAQEAAIGSTLTVSYGGSEQSPALIAPLGAGGLQKYRIVATTSINYLVGSNPTADSTGAFLPANVIDYVWVPSGHKIAAVKVSGGSNGLLSITKVK